MKSDRETDLLKRLAERPDDRALRLVFADWLTEHGDPRGEVIALCERGALSLTERRRVARLTAQHQVAWLGPLAPLVDVQESRFEAGFLTELVCQWELLVDRLPLFAQLKGDPRLATVRTLVVPGDVEAEPLALFLRDGVFRGLRRLRLSSRTWRSLKALEPGPVQPEVVGVSSFGTFERELSPLKGVPLFEGGRTLELATTEHLGGLAISALLESLEAQHAVVNHFERLRLLSRYSMLDGTAAWLLAADTLGKTLSRVTGWEVETSGVRSRLDRLDGSFQRLELDLALPEAPGEKHVAGRGAWLQTQVKTTAAARFAEALAVLGQLAPASLKLVEVRLPPGARLRPEEQRELLWYARRFKTLERFLVDGEPLAAAATR